MFCLEITNNYSGGGVTVRREWSLFKTCVNETVQPWKLLE